MNTPATSPSAGSGRPGRRLALASGLLLSLVLTTTPPTRAESVLFVAQTGTIYNDCLSAAQPCPTINAAINRAGDGDTILIAGGTYTSTTAEVVRLQKSLTLSGGWDPAFTVQDRETVLDGEGARRVVSIWFVSPTLDHLTIARGADTEGAGIYVPGGSVRVVASVVRDNVASGDGGGLCTGGWNVVIDIERSAFVHNTAARAGAIGACYATDFPGRLVAVNSTFSGNTAQDGGGISMDGWYGDGTIELYNSSVVSNTASVSAGGIGVAQAVTVTNSLIVENVAAGTLSDCSGSLISLGYNLFSSTAGCTVALTTGDAVVLHPGVLQLSLPEGVHPLGLTSPAVNGGHPGGCRGPDGQALTTDQRGRPRAAASTVGGVARCDIGAYELQPVVLDAVALTVGMPAVAGQPGSARAQVTPISVTDPVTYTWQFADRSPLTRANGISDTLLLDWPEAGTYALTVTATSAQGSSVMAHQDVVVQPRAILPVAPRALHASAHLADVLALHGPVQNPWSVSISQDNGLTWTPLPLPAGARPDDLGLIRRYETNPPVRVLSADWSQGTLYRTGNYGASWAAYSFALLSGCVQPYDLFVFDSAGAHQIVYAMSTCLVRVECPAGGACVAHLRRQLFESADAGVSWSVFDGPFDVTEPAGAHQGASRLRVAPSSGIVYWAPGTTWRMNVAGVWSDVAGAPFTGDEDSELQVDAGLPDRVFRLAGGEVRVTTNAGAAWSAFAAPLCPAGDDRELVASATQIGVLAFRCGPVVWTSTNAGQSWTLTVTLPAAETGQVFGLGHRLVSDPAVIGRLWILGDQHLWALTEGAASARSVAAVALPANQVWLPTLLSAASPR